MGARQGHAARGKAERRPSPAARRMARPRARPRIRAAGCHIKLARKEGLGTRHGLAEWLVIHGRRVGHHTAVKRKPDDESLLLRQEGGKQFVAIPLAVHHMNGANRVAKERAHGRNALCPAPTLFRRIGEPLAPSGRGGVGGPRLPRKRRHRYDPQGGPAPRPRPRTPHGAKSRGGACPRT